MRNIFHSSKRFVRSRYAEAVAVKVHGPITCFWRVYSTADRDGILLSVSYNKTKRAAWASAEQAIHFHGYGAKHRKEAERLTRVRM